MSASVNQPSSNDVTAGTLPAAVRASALWSLSQLETLLRKEVNATIERTQIPGLNLRGYWALETIAASDRLTQSELSELLSIDRSDMVRLMDALQEAGLAERTRDETDRRRQLISLTDQGNKVRQSLRRSIRRAERQVCTTCPTDITGQVRQWLSVEAETIEPEDTGAVTGEAPESPPVDTVSRPDEVKQSASEKPKKSKKKRNKKKKKARGNK